MGRVKETRKFKIKHIKTVVSSLSSVKKLFKSKESNATICKIFAVMMLIHLAHLESLSWSSCAILFATKVSSQKSNLRVRKDTLGKDSEKGYNNPGKGGDQEEEGSSASTEGHKDCPTNWI